MFQSNFNDLMSTSEGINDYFTAVQRYCNQYDNDDLLKSVLNEYTVHCRISTSGEVDVMVFDKSARKAFWVSFVAESIKVDVMSEPIYTSTSKFYSSFKYVDCEVEGELTISSITVNEMLRLLDLQDGVVRFDHIRQVKNKYLYDMIKLHAEIEAQQLEFGIDDDMMDALLEGEVV